MARKKNLERAIILGLILSTGVYGSAWAENPITEDNASNSSYTGDVTFQGDNDTSAIEITNKEVTIETTNGGTITLDSRKYGIRLEGKGSVTLKPTGDNIITVTTNNTSPDDVGDGINVTEDAAGTITLNGGNNTITVIGEHSDGIYTATDNNTIIEMNANSGDNTINADNNGIDHRGNGDVILTANNINKITATNGDGIRVDGSGDVVLTAKENTITAGDNGIQVAGSGTVNVTANVGSNIIKAGNNGIDISKGTGNITANIKNDITAGSTGINVFGDSNAYIDGKETTITVVKNIPDSSPTTDMAAGINLGEKVGNINTYGNLILGTNEGIKNNKFVIDVTNNNNSKVSSAIGINMSHDSTLRTKNEIGYVSITATNVNGGTARGISVAGSTFDVSVNSFNITAESGINSQSNAIATGISAASNANVKINAANGIIINAVNEQNVSNFDKNTMAIDANKSNVYLDSGSDIVLNYIKNKDDVQKLVSEINKLETGINVGQQGSVVLTSQNINEINAIDGIVSTGANPVQEGGSTEEAKGAVILNAENANNINATQFGIDVDGQNQGENAARVELNAKENNIFVYADTGAGTFGYGINASYDGVAKIGNHDKRADITNIVVKNMNDITYVLKGVDSESNANVDVDSDIINIIVEDSVDRNNVSSVNNVGICASANGKVDFNATAITLNVENGIGIQSSWGSDVNLNSDRITINSYDNTGIAASNNTWKNKDNIVKLDANVSNTVRAGEFLESEEILGAGYGNKKAINANSGSEVSLSAGEFNNLAGAVYANGVDSTTKEATVVNIDSNGNNYILSSAVIANAGGLDGKNTVDNVTTGMDVVSALYAEKGAEINLSGYNNIYTYYSDPSDEHTSERVVWAYDTADINIDGYTNIGTTLYNESPNSKDIAIAAGTATNLDKDKVNATVTDRATVTLNYDNFTTNDGKQAVSEITGDILSAYAGQVDIAGKSADAGIKINGNLLAGNNGILNVNLGKGGVLTGRADDYGDAGANPSGVGDGNDGHQSSEFFDPAFSSEIFKGGEVNLTMGENSRWNVTGQSWITRINTAENSNAIIDLVGSNTDRNTTAHALTVYEMNGDANFNMSLDADRDVSDMLYIKNANGNYVVNVIDAVTEKDMYAARTDGGTFDGLRFATVGKDSTASFRAITYDGGFNNVEYIIGSDSYDESTENHHYNGDSLDAEKPGDSTVDDFFKNNGTPGSTTGATNGLAKASLMALPVNETNNAENDDLTNVEVNTDETTNFKLIGVKNTEVSDGGKTMLNMSRANYSNAIYMDRLNKRLGEARYINSEEDEGMWVRIRHDRIGKDDAYRSQNTMYELGYDQKQECDNGERRVGMAIDYMHGDTGYNDIAGKGEIDRYGLWLYDTWMGDKGHYADYVAKWGHLSNDFEIYNSRGEVTGDYSNNVFSVSAEYGRKKDIGNDWYFEPQVQAQLARVTGADYTTSQGTKVSVDGINSLIGRAGFRLGKDFGEEKQSTVYIKADVLHEFLGDQDIRALDSTTNGNWQTVSYENEGTWYDVGFGFATQMSKNSYAFMDFEKSFGNDNDETYQINVGMQWSF